MIVTDIVKIKGKKKYEIYADDELLVVLSDFGVVDCRIKRGVEVDDVMKERIEEALQADAFETLLRIISSTSTTVSRAKRKLIEKGVDEKYVQNAVKKAQSYGYLNDKEYAVRAVESSKAKSRMRLRFELSEKGVPSKYIDQALEDFDEDSACLQAVKKNIRRPLDDAEKRKFFAKLCNQGFSYDVVKRAYEEFIKEE